MDTEKRVLNGFPTLTQEELDQVDEFFSNYLIFENESGGRRFWTSCCHRELFVEKNGRTEGPEERRLLETMHNETTECPFCRKQVRVKNRKLLKSNETLREYHPVVFLRVSEDGGTVWCQGYWTTRDFKSDPAGLPLYMVTRVYRFKRGEALEWECWGGQMVQGKTSKGGVHEPFQKVGLYSSYEPYHIIGYERLEESFLRYSWYDVPMGRGEADLWETDRRRTDLMRYLDVAARFPENVEMLRKADMDEPVWDLVYQRKKNARVLKWGETDPKKAFGLTKAELNEFLGTDRSLDTLYAWKELHKAGWDGSFGKAEQLKDDMDLYYLRMILGKARTYGVPVKKLIRYLERATEGPYGGVGLRRMAGIWKDYMDMAAQLGYDMANPINQMPRELQERHDALAQAVQVKRSEELEAKARERYESLQKRYAYEDESCLIRAPLNAQEIIDEGKALKHCVGGYAERHANGAVTILFLREKAHPTRPYVTIEMRGNDIVQIHGYKNEGVKGAVSPRITHEKLLNEWLNWLKAGSRRDKQGAPVRPKKQKKGDNVA
jgi:hypothetical protein